MFIAVGLIQAGVAAAALAAGYTSLGLVLGLLAVGLLLSELTSRGDRSSSHGMRNSALVFAVVGLFFAAYSTLQLAGALPRSVVSVVLCYIAAVGCWDLALRINRDRAGTGR